MKPTFATYQDRNKWVDQQVKAIAAALKATLVQDVDSRPTSFTLGDEERVHVSYDESKHRFRISGSFHLKSRVEANKTFGPWDCNPKPESGDISVDANKTSEQIAADIARRLLPVYRAALVLVKARRDASDKYWLDCRTLTEDIAAALNVLNPRAADSRYNRLSLDSGKHSCWGSVECHSESASFEIRSLPADKAVKLAKFLSSL